ncbi:MAG: restriction endonuclease subunit S [Streptococcaceae bacterium]|jgi:hypothetical protein|nr:restriction endonuclease subunit S [Streptococcaceae bacterium]
MIKLEDREWFAFDIEELFEMKTGASVAQDNLKLGKLPRITATDINNGIGIFSQIADNKNFREVENVITYSFLGSAFYHPYNISLDMKIHSLKAKDQKLNRYIGLFCVQALKSTIIKPNYGNQVSSKDLLKKKILLPIDKNNNPDWQFMEDYIKERYQLLINQYKEYLGSLDMTGGAPTALDGKEWGEFMLSDVFTISAGKRLTKDDMKNGKRPFIGATDSNNGITNFVSNENVSLDKEVLGVNYNGSVVETFYHPYESIFSDDVKRFSVKDGKGNKFVYLFLKSTIMQQKSKYAYGYKFNEARMKKQVILLPVNTDKTPDWEYMENYSKWQMKQQLEEYMKYIE